MTDLVTTMNLLDHLEFKGSAHRLLDQEFLSFLHSVHERRQGREEIHLLAESAASVPPASLTRWLARHPEFSAHVELGNTSLRQAVAEWIGDVITRRPTQGAPASLPQLQTAVERRVREAGDGRRAFAWTKE